MRARETKDTGEKRLQEKTQRRKADPTRYVKVTRLGKVSIYRRGKTYWLYFRDGGETVRKSIDGNLTTARATASEVNSYLEQKKP